MVFLGQMLIVPEYLQAVTGDVEMEHTAELEVIV